MKRDRGFTLVELQIVAVISLFILSSVMLVFHNRVRNFIYGNERIFLQNEVQRVMKHVYFDFKKVIPRLILDKNYDIWITGESKKNFIFNTIDMFENDGKLDNGKEIIKFHQYTINNINKPNVITYYKYENFLIKKINEEYEIISKYMDSFKVFYDFDPNFGQDSRKIVLFYKISLMGKNSKVHEDKVNLHLRIDSDYIKVKSFEKYEKYDDEIRNLKEKLGDKIKVEKK